ncbi:hypothetical protein SDC9_137877 [bioreactor metagenome]|uniref:Uncharacterized protein n=1 Tax=bioreactor metagenome TaxID=1076179 RepID=A0A645DND5_9ZZZZ
MRPPVSVFTAMLSIYESLALPMLFNVWPEAVVSALAIMVSSRYPGFSMVNSTLYGWAFSMSSAVELMKDMVPSSLVISLKELSKAYMAAFWPGWSVLL